MRRMGLRFFLICFLFSHGNTMCGQPTVVYSDPGKNKNIGGSVSILEDKNNKMTVNEAANSKEFKAATGAIPNLGVSNSAFWIKIAIQNNSNAEDLFLELAYPIMDVVEFYSPSIGKDGFTVVKTGDSKKFDERKYDNQNFIFDIHVPQNETRTYYMKVMSGEQIVVPLVLGTPQLVFETNLKKDILFGIYFGVIFAMFLYNLFIYFIVKDKSYLYYIVYVLFIALTQSALQGYTFKYLWPSSPWFANHCITLFPSIAGFATVGFIRSFLQSKIITPKLDKGLYVIVIIYCLSLFANFILNNQNLSYNLIDLDATLISLYALIIAIVIAARGYRQAKFFLFGWSLFLVGVIGFVLKNVGVLPENNFTDYTMSAGTVLEVLIFSFALADRINVLRKEKEESQARVLEALEENERITTEQNIILDQKVKVRTAELETSNRNLKDTQVQLVNAEKMASLGQLTAGIAHEINNPINFVISSVTPLKRDIKDVLSLLASYGEIKDEKNLIEKLKEINTLKKKLDSDYLVEEIDLLLKGIDEGAVRTSEIVKGLQNFSRLDEEGLKVTNIHTGIDATLLLLNSLINNAEITIVKDYAALPNIECHPGKLNQVFMNILNNAVQALQSSGKKEKEIIIKTERIGDRVNVRIKDNGPGMTEEVKNRIFEPFFTTKDVGEGTGLGLSIAFGIIEKHKGTITVESTPGVGTEFIISLPIHSG